MYTISESKIALSPYDDKRYVVRVGFNEDVTMRGLADTFVIYIYIYVYQHLYYFFKYRTFVYIFYVCTTNICITNLSKTKMERIIRTYVCNS